jgi:c-di-GMP-binding flagellar brake protein YcgR
VSQTSGLTVRQHEREGILVPVELIIGGASAAQVRLSPSSNARTAHTIRGEAVDISSGGMGLRCRHFVPRMCEGTLRVFAPSTNRTGDEGSGDGELMFEQQIKVRRVVLIGREPAYALGVAFVDPTPDLDRRIDELFGRLQHSSAKGVVKRVGETGGHRA